MKISALLTSAGINIGLCALFLSLYSILRKQPSNVGVYFGRRLSEERNRREGSFSLDKLVPSAGWIVKAWELTEDEILSIAGLDAVVFLRMLRFSIRIFSIAAAVCVFGVLPLNYFGKEMKHETIHRETVDIFTIQNVQEGSQWWRLRSYKRQTWITWFWRFMFIRLWVHCLALYIISFSACALLYFEYSNISKMRLVYITRSSPNPSQFSVLVRSIPITQDEPLDVTIVNFFTKNHGSSYLSHQMIYKTGKVQKILSNARKAYKKFVRVKVNDQKHRSSKYRCGLCGGRSHSFHLYRDEYELDAKRDALNNSASSKIKKECAAAFVFFKTRYAAVIASRILQSSNPMLWAIDLAPEPHDVYWSNLWIPYDLLWFRRIAVQIATLAFMCVFIGPVTFVQGLSHLDKLQQKFPVFKDILKKKVVTQIVTGYLPSVILMLALYTVPPIMMILSGVEGAISYSGQRRSACCKILYFTIWNLFFVNVFAGPFIKQFIASPKGIPSLLAQAVPQQASFFITYVLTSGWAGLSAELLQLFPLVYNLSKKILFRSEDDSNYVQSFPYYTEVPKVLLFGLIGFTCSIFAPLILPFLLVYFSLGYLVYRNQIFNVYLTKYESGGKFWPVVHNTTIFALVLTQIIALGVFGCKKAPIPSTLTIPLVICTLLFSEACRHRFGPIFSKLAAQDLIDMDQQDEQSGRMEEIHRQLVTLYCQYTPNKDVLTDSLELREHSEPGISDNS